MKKTLKGLACVGLSAALLTTTLATACGDKPNGQNYNTETRQLQLSTAALDGNFNPFFYTSATDGSILSMTQASMLAINDKGQIKVGYDEPCVVAYYNETMYDASGNVTTKGDENGKTVYEFVIKNGLKFSNGSDLTIHDVLFNLYTYLDPSYSGSSTLYSTNIVGLKAYRAQDESVEDDDVIDIDSEYNASALRRINNILDWIEDSPAAETTPSDENIAADIETTYKLFKEEITSDWTAIETSWYESYKNSYRFTEAWQAYLLNEGVVKVQEGLVGEPPVQKQLFEDKNGNGKREDGELYYTTLDPQQKGAIGGQEGEVVHQDYIDIVNAASTEEKITNYINGITGTKPTRDEAKVALQKAACIDIVYKFYSDKSSLGQILSYWATGSQVMTKFANEARTEHYEQIKQDGSWPVPTVKGITTYLSSGTFKDKSAGNVQLDNNYVLRVEVKGIDPKAVYNFGFTVAPMYYYSSTNYKGVNYVKEAMDDEGGKAQDGAQITHFGIEQFNSDFFDDVLKASEKNKLPVGAGAYKATTASGGDNPVGSTFYENNVVYFKRNDNFQTFGGGKEGGIQNAKIKYVNYKVMSDDKIMEALTTKKIDFGTPNANTTNVATVTQNSSFLAKKDYLTGGYGYIGLNPKFIPEYKVRQAIMKSFNTSRIIADYYGGIKAGLAEVIYRPMSVTSWAYPKTANGDKVGEYAGVAYDSSLEEVKTLIAQSGYELRDGIYTKTQIKDGMNNAALGTKLKMTFTIAGESTDHPTYKLFVDTANELNAIGFDITVATDIQALKKMNTGNLTVWAAAWTAATDPDLYQVYHKDSKATSVNNWNYPAILSNPGAWTYESNVIESLSEKIMEARSYSDQDERVPIYAECLDYIMSLYVEMPTYQRKDLCVYNKTVIDEKTLVQSPNNYIGLFDKIWEISYV